MEFLSAPFSEPAVRHSFAAVLAIALSAGPVGVFLMLRRMSLVGDAMSHAILPGAAVGYLVSGLNVFAMTLGGLAAGLVIAVLAGLVARATDVKEDASLAVFLLASLALGVVIVTTHGMDAEELMHFLFGETAFAEGVGAVAGPEVQVHVPHAPGQNDAAVAVHDRLRQPCSAAGVEDPQRVVEGQPLGLEGRGG